MRRLDEPVRWQIADYRAVTLEPRDNLWLRILDVPAVLASRRYDTNGSVTVRVTDPLGFAEGTWQLDVDAAGEATVTAVDPADDATSSRTRVELGIGELSSVFLGGVSVDTLARAGRITGTPDAIRQADAVFHSAAEPWLPFWF
jgi:predicted acetyltransferase